VATEALGRPASAGDRERAIERLRAAAGQLGLDELEDRGLRTLKGLSRPRHLVAVRWAD
jgi:hypothetical protein